jgi:protein-arginine kinase activator protein McsA
MKMKKTIIEIRKCENCGKKSHYIIRQIGKLSSTNSDLTDTDIWRIVVNAREDNFEFRGCEKCNLYTKQTIVAYKGLYNDGK